MTAYELRRHLYRAHDVNMNGADYGTLLTVHDVEHRGGGADHSHDEWTDECLEFGCHDSSAGHFSGDFVSLLWFVVCVLFIILLLRALGVQI